MRAMHCFAGTLIALAACGDDTTDPIAPDAAAPRERIVETKMLIGSEIAEATLEGGPGDRAQIQLASTTANLDWNIHGHAGGSSQTIVEEIQVMSAAHDFQPPADAAWSLLLRNHSAIESLELTVTIDLYGDMQWRGWE